MPRMLVLCLLAGLAACGDGGEVGIADAPNPDPDADGVLGQADFCPAHAEVFNRVWDSDGCPDSPLDFYFDVRSDAESFWTEALEEAIDYRRLTAFQGYTASVDTPCGVVGPGASYCPTNEHIYYDVDYLGELLEASGVIAPAFVIAHEVGHHVSNLLMWPTDPDVSPKELEWQADCFAGAWTYSANDRDLLEANEVDEAVVELVAVLRGAPPADTWFDPIRQGTDAQRSLAFALGFDGGMDACTTQAFFDQFVVFAG